MTGVPLEWKITTDPGDHWEKTTMGDDLMTGQVSWFFFLQTKKKC